MRFSNTVVIQRDPHDVFGFIAAFENVPRWNYAIAETRKISEGPVAVGTKYRQIRSLPSRSEEEFDVAEFAADDRVAIHGTFGPFHGTLTYIVEPDEHGTRLTNTAELEGSGIMKIAAPLATRRVRDAVASNLNDLKNLLES